MAVMKETIHNCLWLVSLIAVVVWSSSSNASSSWRVGGRVRCVWRPNNGCEGDLLMAHGWFWNNVRRKVWIDSCNISWQLQWGKWSYGKKNSLVNLARVLSSLRRLWMFYSCDNGPKRSWKWVMYWLLSKGIFIWDDKVTFLLFCGNRVPASTILA